MAGESGEVTDDSCFMITTLRPTSTDWMRSVFDHGGRGSTGLRYQPPLNRPVRGGVPHTVPLLVTEKFTTFSYISFFREMWSFGSFLSRKRSIHAVNSSHKIKFVIINPVTWSILSHDQPCHMISTAIWSTLSHDQPCHMINPAIWSTLPPD